MAVRVANAAGFWGDDIDAPQRLVESAEVDYLTLEYLAELTMSILAHLKSKDPNAGFATDVLTVVRDLLPAFKRQSQLRLITNAGGINPKACAAAVSRLLTDAGLGQTAVGVVTGDDLLPHLSDLQAAGCELRNLDTGEPLSSLPVKPVSANAYLGAPPIAAALQGGSRLVITGRVADASLTVGPCIHEFGWDWTDWERVAAATVAGHLIECGAQVTGGYSDRWREIDFVNMGYPIAEVESDGTCIITKPPSSGGIVDRRTVVEQLVYEIGDPAAYYTPDVVADFTSVRVRDLGQNRVQVSGARGLPASDTYKVSLAYPAGYMASAMLVVAGPKPLEKARRVGELVFERLERCGFTYSKTNIECFGGRESHLQQPSGASPESLEEVAEVVLRVTAQDPQRESVERFTKEIAPLITNGPSGLAGYASGRPAVRPVLAYWPTLVPKDLVKPSVEIRSANDWVRS